MKKFTIEDLKKIPLKDLRPILKAKVDEFEQWKKELEKIPETELQNPAAEALGWTDRFLVSRAYAGIRRGANIGIHLVGWTLVNSAALIAAGKDIPTALISGAALAGGESILSLSAEKQIKEKLRGKGGAPLGVAEWVVAIITTIFRAWRDRKKKG